MKRYYITDRKSAGGFRPLLEIIRDQLRFGVEYIQLREKDLTARELFEFTLAVIEVRARESQDPSSTKIIVNSRADVALASGADGVHLPAYAPSETPRGMLIARSCHTIEEVRNSQADFVTLSPIFDSPGKGEPLGLSALKAASKMSVPVFALGGISWENARDCIEAGAIGIAGIRLFQNPEL